MQRNKAVITNQVDSSVIIRVFLTAGYLQLALHFMNRDQPFFRGDCGKVSGCVNSVGWNLGHIAQIFKDLRMAGRCFCKQVPSIPV